MEDEKIMDCVWKQNDEYGRRDSVLVGENMLEMGRTIEHISG